MIRVLYTIPNFDTAGSGKALLKIASRLDKTCFEPHICCLHDRGAFFNVVKDSGIPVHIYPFTAEMSNRLNGLSRVWRISRFFKRIQPDLIHSFHYAPDYSEALAARVAGIKWIFTKKNMNWGGVSKNAWYLRSKLANGIIAQNSDMLRNFFPGCAKVSLISRGVDIDEFSPIYCDRSELFNQLKLPDVCRYIVCVANLVPVKGLDVLIRAFQELYQVHPDIRLIIVGDDSGEYGKSIKNQVAETNLTDYVFFTGKVMNVVDYLHVADILVLPTLKHGEGSPVAPLEAMACGVIVVASDVSGVRDQFERNPDLLFTSGDYHDLKDKLCHILRLTDAEKKQLGLRLRQEVIERFTIQSEVKAHEHFYKQILVLN